jgi:hypothetical protein
MKIEHNFFTDMNTSFKNGFKKALLYYVLAAILIFFAYAIFGWEYRHAPGLHHFVALLFLIGGIIWALYCFVSLLIRDKLKVNLGILTVHMIAILSVVLYVYIDIKKANAVEAQPYPNPENIINIKKDTINKIGIIVNGNGDTLFLRKGDSVLIDRMPKFDE